MKKKSDNQKLKKTNQQNTEIETAYLNFYQAYKSQASFSATIIESKKENEDMEFFQKFFKNDGKLPEFILPGHLRNLLGKRPGTFCRFLEYPSFRDMILGVSPDCEKEEAARGNSFIEGLKISLEKEIDRINKEIEVRDKGLAERTAEIDKIKKEINKRIEEISKINTEINKGNKDAAKGNAEIDKIKIEIAKIDGEIDKLKEPDKRNKEERDNWLNLKKAINIYINGPELYSELVRYILFNRTFDIGVLDGWSKKLIGYLLEKDPLPPYIEQETLFKIILRAPVTLSVFFQYPNFFKRLIGFSLDNIKDDDANEKWKNFLKMFNFKLDAIRSPQQTNSNATMPVMEQLTQSRYEEIFNWIDQNQKLLAEQVAEKNYEKNCQDFAAALNANFLAVKNFMKTHANPLGESIEKEMPSCLTAKLLKRLVMYAPAYAIKYFDNYYFMLRLLADDMKGKDLTAADIFYDLQDKFDLANFADKKRIELSLKQWEIRLRLNIAINALIREIRGLIGQPTKDESKKEINALDLGDKKVANTVIEKMIRISAGVISPIQYQWIEQLTVLMEKFPKSFASNLVKEINIYLSEKSLLEEIRAKAQSLQQKNAPVVSVEPEEHVSPRFRL